MRLKRGVLIGRPFGIPLVVHGSWFPAAALLVFHFALTAYAGLSRPSALGLGVVSALAFFASLVAHELGHALVARAFGIPVADITLFVFGGVARIRREPSRPSQEVVIAAAGPLVSAGIGTAALALAGSGTAGDLVRTLGLANLALFGFNLLPGFPLDGGRILRAVLWARGGDPHRAALTAGRSGQLIGGALGVLGLCLFLFVRGAVEGVWLVVMGAFLYALATAARRGARLARRLGSQTAGTWARAFAGTLDPEDLRPRRVDAPYAVASDGRLEGVVLPVATGGPVRVRDAMLPWTSDLAVSAVEPLTRALERLADGAKVLVVVDDAGSVLGVLDHAGVRARLGSHNGNGDGKARTNGSA